MTSKRDGSVHPGLWVGVCGPLAVMRGGVEIGALPVGQRALLGVLALSAGRPVLRNSIVGALWPDEPPATAPAIVQTYVSRLRRLLGDARGRESCISRDGAGYRLHLPAHGLDLLAFREYVARARESMDDGRACALLERAMRLWRGDPLDDVEVLRPYPAVAAAANERVLAALDFAGRAAAAGRHEVVLSCLTTMAASRPLDEVLHAALMVALAGSGRQSDSLSVYEGLRRRLDEELGVLPSDVLREAHQRVLRQQIVPASSPNGHHAARQNDDGPTQLTLPAAPRSLEAHSWGPDWHEQRAARLVPAQLPSDIADFTGRSEAVAHLCSVLSARDPGSPGATRVVLVAGAGGLGKTRLAIHSAHQLRPLYPDGQMYADLLGTTTSPQAPTDVLVRFLHDLGVESSQIPPSEEARAALFRTRLAERAVLLLLDNARDAAQVRPLLPGSSACAVIVTSRDRMPGLAGTGLVDLGAIDDDESRALFTRIVGEERAAAEPESAAEVLSACAGMPLAIRICAARLAIRSRWSIQALADRLRARPLDELKTGDMAIRASFQVSFANLPGDGEPARAFRLLGLWQGPFITLPAATALLDREEGETAEALETLVDACLLDSPAPDQYRFHDLMRVYAGERAQDEENVQDRAAALRRLLEWYLHSADSAATKISPHRTRPPVPEPSPGLRPLAFSTLAAAMRWFEDERRNIVAATLAAAGGGMDSLAWLLPASTLVFFSRRGYHSDWITTHKTALTSVRRAGDRAGEAHVLHNLGLAYSALDQETAVRYLVEAIEIHAEKSGPKDAARSWSNLLHTHLIWGRFSEVVALRHEVLRIEREAGNVNGEGVTLTNVAEAYLGLGQVSEAVSYLHQSGEIFDRTGYSRGQAHVLRILGDAYQAQGRIDEAVKCYQGAAEKFHATLDGPGEVMALLRLGRACGKSGLAADARTYLSRAHELFGALGDETHAVVARSELMSIPAGEPQGEPT